MIAVYGLLCGGSQQRGDSGGAVSSPSATSPEQREVERCPPAPVLVPGSSAARRPVALLPLKLRIRSQELIRL